jgi:hypothetical protein
MKRTALIVIMGGLVAWQTAWAYTSVSTHYQIQDGVLGGSGGVGSSSGHYQAQGSAGEPAVGGQYPAGGNSSSTNYQSNGGYVTTSDPALSFSVNGGTTINFGSLSTSATATATSTFNVINYTSYSYIVQILGNPPSSGSHTLSAMSGGVSMTGTEQFGINLESNTTPSIGANPSGGNGAAYGGYATANSYKYNSGDTIAQATKSSGQTNYTVSYIANAATSTPGGSYSGTLTLICTGTY